MDAVVVEVVAQRLGPSLPQRRGRFRLGRVVEPENLGEPARPVLGFDVLKDAAGADRGQLAVVPDEADAAATDHDLGDRPVEAEGVGHAGFVDDDQALWADSRHPRGRRLLGMVEAPAELGERVAGHVELVGKGLRGGRGRRQSDHGAAGLRPRRAEDAHGSGLAGAGRGDRELDAPSGAGHLADEVALAARQLRPVGECFELGEVDEPGATARPSVRPALATMRCSASRMRLEVYQSTPGIV